MKPWRALIVVAVCFGAAVFAGGTGNITRLDLFKRFFSWAGNDVTVTNSGNITANTHAATASSGNNGVTINQGARFRCGNGADSYITCDATGLSTPGDFDFSGGATFTNFDAGLMYLTDQTAHPGAPSAGTTVSYSFIWDSGFPSIPTTVDSFMRLPTPGGMLSGFGGAFGAAGANWNCQCTNGNGWGSGTFTNSINTIAPTATGSTSSNAWASTSLLGRMRWLSCTGSAAANTSVGARDARQSVWRGDTAGAGGWVSWQRFGQVVLDAGSRVAVGFFNTTGALSAAADPSAATDSVYVGCNNGDANMSVWSNDNVSTATAAAALGSSFPCGNLNGGRGFVYDVFFAAPPNGSVINYRVDRLDTTPPVSASGQITSDLPRNTVQMGWHIWANSGSGAYATNLAVINACVCANF